MLSQDLHFLDSPYIPKTYRVYKYRYLISMMYMISAIVSGVMWVSTSPLTTKLQSIYGLNLFTISLGTSLVWLIIYTPMSFVSNYVIDEMGIRKAVLMGNFLTVIGLWVRTFSKESFYYILAGQVLGALGQPCILNAPQKISGVWYSPRERTLSTAALTIASPIGVGIGFFLPHLFVRDNAIGLEGLIQVNDLMYTTAIAGTALLVPCFFLFKEKPITPPSILNSKAAEKERPGYIASLNRLLKNRNYLTFTAAAGCIWGTYNILIIVLEPLIAPFGYSSSQSSIYGGFTIFMGVIGSLMLGFYVGRTRKYKKSLIILSILSMILLTVLFTFGQLSNPFFKGVGIALYGIFTTPMLPIIFEMSVEITFPVGEANAGGLTFMVTQAFGAVGALAAHCLLVHQTKMTSIGAFSLLIVFQVLGIVGFSLVEENLRREKFEQGILSDSDSTKEEISYGIASQH